MKKITMKTNLIIGIFCLLSIFTMSVSAQNIRYGYQYRLDLTGATEAPKMGGTPDIDLPKEALKNGVEGTLKVSMILGKDGKIKDTKFEETLPYGIEEAVIEAYKTFKFQPATRNGEPIDTKLFLEYTISAVYQEWDKDIKKAKITDQPDAVYPTEMLSDGRKDSVSVDLLLSKDGKVTVLRVSSSMPKAFDKSAAEAAEKIKFEPATHKKSKKPVSMTTTVEFKFKP